MASRHSSTAGVIRSTCRTTASAAQISRRRLRPTWTTMCRRRTTSSRQGQRMRLRPSTGFRTPSGSRGLR
eukprot:7171106-Pyramimonas_sp.AAC.1